MERTLFVLTVLWGASIFWFAPHPPMVDLPQHAGQVMLLRDLVFGQARWADVVRLNWFTPYLISYVLAFPLSFVLPIAAALKLLLSLAYLAFVWMCLMLRRHFDADARLDWLFVLPFFGLAYKWGFLTFLVAAPVALAMVLVSSRYAQRPTPARALAVFAAGMLLLASHGLAFAFGWSAGAALLVAHWWQRRFHVAAFVPFALLALVCACYFVFSRRFEADFNVVYGYFDPADWNLKRLIKVPLFTVGSSREDLLLLPFVAVLFAAPWLLGLRLGRGRAITCVPFLVTAAIMALVPSFALNISFIYERFAVFLLPAYAWMFSAAPATALPEAQERSGVRMAVPLLVLTCWSVLATHSVRAWRFGQETADIDAAMHRLEPNQRALTLVFDTGSEAAGHRQVYVHYPVWYQAEHGGLVDFNFAWFPPQIVRFQAQRLPLWWPGFEWTPERFDWKAHGGAGYRYFFVRHAGAVPPELFRGADCAPVAVWAGGPWTIFERQRCR